MDSQHAQPKRPFSPGWIIAFMAIALLAANGAVPRSLPFESRMFARQILLHLAVAVMLTAFWALFFRPQVERWRFSLRSLLVLTTMLAGGVWLVQAAWPLKWLR